jgi:hypothetical protein
MSLLLEVVDPPTFPANPISPNRPAVAAIGLLAGMLLGSLLALRRWLAAPTFYWKYALAAAALGAIVAALASFAIPDRYVSTAVLRFANSEGQAAGERIQEFVQQVRSRESLSSVIDRPLLQLYEAERARRSMDEVVRLMRDRDLRVEPLRDSPLGGRPNGFRISFEYPDREKAHACVQALVNRIVESGVAVPFQRDATLRFDNNLAENSVPLERDAVQAPPSGPTLPTLTSADLLTGTTASPFAGKPVERTGDSPPKPSRPYLEVLDPASMPETPVSPNRFAIMGIGCLAGLLLGPAIARLRRRSPHSTPA